ncbi:mucoidy inhibitor MuiA family protein [Nocardia sp. SYP-A9097]|uniref:mucoidy inhibitor MuiA family protein n=1 Tax=Nocardia sp. SYP-A9097 TaxID=2663237 RepID=UPI00129A4A84|nr:mucoidy inhibitor MuiA family protein [Nocardia sp. SYP-A9097]MRH92696.1 mucoidy inhibitor MuiA family protein [Nocardia sp. SYP-A9097]
MITLDTVITAVTVYPDRARVTRSGKVDIPEGEHRIRVAPLPLRLLRDSIRVAGQGDVTVLGVDIGTERQPDTADEQVAELEGRIRELEAAMSALADTDRAAEARIVFLERLARRSAETLAKADSERVTEFVDGLEAQYETVHTARREREALRQEHIREQQAIQRRLGDLRGKNRNDTQVAVITVEAARPVTVDLDITYVVPEASWSSSYDLRLADTGLTLRWFGLVRQRTGEDWPECKLQLSTARPANALDVPELDAWFITSIAPEQHRMARKRSSEMVAGGAPVAFGAAPAAPAAARPPVPVRESVATVEHSVTAATYSPQRTVAVPSDNTEHRTVITALDLEARLDYVTAPVQSPEAVLRATARNTSDHTLPSGRAALFHEAEFVGATDLETWAPGEERELALGVDDRIRIERELVRRNATKVTLGTARRTEVEYTITVANHSARPATVTILDRLPITRDAAITVRETVTKPQPADRNDLGILTWKSTLDPQAQTTITFGYRVEAAKGVTIFGLPD